jgi:hypothetical protein
MKPKTIVTVCLLAFVAVSVAQLVIQKPPPAANTPQPTGGVTDVAAPPATDTAGNEKIIAYYFHGNKRCDTCRSIEAYSKEAFDTGFPEAMESGAIEWRIVNVDEPENDHFVEEFELITRSVVLDRPGTTTATSWKNLDQVWDLVGDKDVFIQYIQDETRMFLAAETPE